MAKLTSEERKKLPEEDFALSKGHYPYDTKNRGVAALGYSKRYASNEDQKKIKGKVCDRYKDLPSCKRNSQYENPLD